MRIDFPLPLVHGTLIKRYKRFLADVELDSGEIVTAHCTNSGSMKSCLEEGAPVYLSPVNDPNRKTKFTWEMIWINDGWVGINTSIPNLVAYEWVKAGIIPGLEGYTQVKREVKFGDSRFDLFAENGNEQCFIEVKNVTLKEGDWALFPDAQTTRGQKHLQTLMEVKAQGMRAVMLYIVQREDVKTFGPAWNIDPAYAKLLLEAHGKGVEIIPLQTLVEPEGVSIVGVMPYILKN